MVNSVLNRDETLIKSVAILKKRWGEKAPLTAMVCGSGWANVTSALTVLDELSYEEIECLCSTTVEGHVSKILLVKTKNGYAIIFQGRRHYYEGVAWKTIAQPILLSYELGCRNIILTNAAGGISTHLTVGDLMIINDSKEISLFADVKFMYTPIYLDTLPKQISENTGIEIKKYEIGNIEREAYDSYLSWINGGAKVAIISLATFHPNLILSDFADRMEILFRDERERNHFSSGSTTPRVNIHLSKMQNFFEFIEDNLLQEKIDEQKRQKFMNYCIENFSFIGLPNNIASSSANSVQSELSLITKRDLQFLKI